MRKIADSMIGGTLALSISAIIVKIIGVVYKVPLTYMLGDVGMGYFNSAYTIYGFFYIVASSGIPKAIAILTAKSSNENNRYLAIVIYRKSLKLFFVLGILVTAVLVVFSRPLADAVGNSKAHMTLLAIAPSILFITVSGVARGYLNGLSRLGPIATAQVIESVSKLVLGLIFAYIGTRLSLPLQIVSALTILGITLGSLFSMVYLYIVAKTEIVEENTGQRFEIDSKSLLTKVFKIAFPITASAAILSLSSIIDLGLIMNGLKQLGYSELEASSQYGNYTTLTIPMLNLVVAVLSPFSISLLPRLVSFDHSKDLKGFNNLFSWGVRITLFLSIPCFFSFFLYSFDLLDLLFESSSALVGSTSLIIISSSMVMLPLLTILNTGLEAKGGVALSGLSLLIGSLVKTILTWYLLPEFRIASASIGTNASYLISIVISYVFLRIYKVRIRNHGFINKLIISTFSFVPPFILIYATGILEGTWGCIISLLISYTLYFALSFICEAILRKVSSKTTQKCKAVIME